MLPVPSEVWEERNPARAAPGAIKTSTHRRGGLEARNWLERLTVFGGTALAELTISCVEHSMAVWALYSAYPLATFRRTRCHWVLFHSPWGVCAGRHDGVA